MKFTAAYLLGASTVIGLGASFIAGAFTYAWVNDKKNTKLEEAKQEDVLMQVAKLIKSQKNKG